MRIIEKEIVKKVYRKLQAKMREWTVTFSKDASSILLIVLCLLFFYINFLFKWLLEWDWDADTSYRIYKM